MRTFLIGGALGVGSAGGLRLLVEGNYLIGSWILCWMLLGLILNGLRGSK